MAATRQLLAHLYELWGNWTLSGQSNCISWLNRSSEEIQQISGEWPAIWAANFGWTNDHNSDDWIGDRDGLIDEVGRQAAANSIIQLDFYPINPVLGEPGSYQESLVATLSDREWEAMLTPGTSIFTHWRTQLDIIGVFLRYLMDMGIVVLLRPCPSMNSSRFWWGNRPGPAGYAGLWRSIHDHYCQNVHLDNLLFVWSAESGQLSAADFYPGHDLVDVLGCDMYGVEGSDYPFSQFETLRKLGEGRPVALTRAGPIPDNDILARQRWLWFMVEQNSWRGYHQAEDLRIAYVGDYLLHRNEWQNHRQAR